MMVSPILLFTLGLTPFRVPFPLYMSAPINQPIKPVETRRLYQHIADQIRALLQQGDFPVGSRLPPERDLAQQLGVSRPSLREALIALEISGSVEIRMGSGVYVCATPGRTLKPGVALGDSPTELMQARAAIEGACVLMACAQATPERIARLHYCVEAMRQDIAHNRSPLENDRAFHLSLAEMSGNSVFVRLVAELFDERHSPISTKLSDHFESTDTWNKALTEHELICRAIEERNPLAAELAIRTHLKASERRWIDN